MEKIQWSKGKKRGMVALIIIIVLLLIGGWYFFLGNRIPNVTGEVEKGTEETKSLVVYFSRSGVIKIDGVDATSSASLNLEDDNLMGNTEIPARMIQKVTGADLFQIQTERYYRSAFMGTSITAWAEEKFNMRPNLAAIPENLDQYDVIYVGYPIWWFNAPMAIGSFFDSYDLTGKTIIPFCTSQDNGIDVSMNYIREVCKDATVLEGRRLNNPSEAEIRSWLEELGVENEITETSKEESQEETVKTAISNNENYDYHMEEIWSENNGNRIYGQAYIPETEEKIPLVIFSHELCNTHTAGIDYAEELASHGVATYTFDFNGGSSRNQSDGKTTEMSVMTEVSDLEAVMKDAKTWGFVDTSRIILLGGSQGGMVSAITAARHTDDLAGLVLLYPAFVIPDAIHNTFSSKDAIPGTFNFLGWIQVGRNYATDVWDYDVYSEIGSFDKDVLIIHGDRDYSVDLSYSERAKEAYENCELHVIKGAGHGFYGSSFDEAMDQIWEYLAEIE
ncbi:flavodoxin [Lachnospiraceae bacterium KM106-2]|nr:flavodoxin [Lachnospiraceae bacterium KM106-2]